MCFTATEGRDYRLWQYIIGDYYKKMSIAVDRYHYLQKMDSEYHGFKIALRDPDTNNWTKWNKFPHGLLTREYRNGYMVSSGLSATVDVHRSMLPNEIIIESDYEDYKENYVASKIIGDIIEEKGFEPLYYYSGSKSIHVHVYIDNTYLDFIEQTARVNGITYPDIKKSFMTWLRKKMITCWDTNYRQFDKDLINDSHLIRCELSRNKKGFKTFLGYTHKDLSFIPSICNEINTIYPELGQRRTSIPNNAAELMDEFFTAYITETNEKVAKRKNAIKYGGYEKGKIRECVKVILDDEFKKIGDGFKRGLFILANELRSIFDDATAKQILYDWNTRMGSPLDDRDIEYKFKSKAYRMGSRYIYEFLNEIGAKKT